MRDLHHETLPGQSGNRQTSKSSTGINPTWAGPDTPLTEVLDEDSKVRVPFPSAATLAAQEYLERIVRDPNLAPYLERVNSTHQETRLPRTTFPTALPRDVRVRIHAALTGTPQIIGGYAMASGSSRPNRVYVPAGSAWWCTLEGGDTHQGAATLRLLNNAHTLGEPREALFGFGHTLVGLGPTIEETNP